MVIPSMASRSSKSRSVSVSWTARIGLLFRRYFLTGLAALFPGAVTVWLLVKIFEFTDGLLGNMFHLKIPGLGLVLTIVVVLLVGVLSTHLLGRVVFPALEVWFVRLPLVNKIYPTVKQLSRSIFSEDEQHATFRRVVMVEYPKTGVYSLAFVTNEGTNAVMGGSKPFVTLLIPTPPNPFTGPVIFMPTDDVIPLQLSVEEAIRVVVSGGVVAPSLKEASPPS